MGRSYRKYVKENFQNDIINHLGWEHFWNGETDPEILWEVMENIILECANIHCPIKKDENL